MWSPLYWAVEEEDREFIHCFDVTTEIMNIKSHLRSDNISGTPSDERFSHPIMGPWLKK